METSEQVRIKAAKQLEESVVERKVFRALKRDLIGVEENNMG